MSLLWRLAVTNLAHLKGASLGPSQEQLRLLLAADDPADYLVSPCMLTALKWQGKHITDLIIPPVYTRFEGRRLWAFVITGFLFYFSVSKLRPPQQFWPGFLQPNGDLPLHVSEVKDIPFLMEWIVEIGAAEKARKDGQPPEPRS